MMTSATSQDCLAALTGERFEKSSKVGIALLGGICTFIGIAYAQHAGSDHLTVNLKWPLPGAQIAVIEGPINKAGAPFTARLKFPANGNVPAHRHCTIEHVMVISDVMNMGVGDKLDTSKTQSLGPGSVSIMQAGTHHFVWFGEETVLQLHGIDHGQLLS